MAFGNQAHQCLWPFLTSTGELMHRRVLTLSLYTLWEPAHGGRNGGPLLAPAVSPLSLSLDFFPWPHENGLRTLSPYLGGRLCLKGWEMSVPAPFTFPTGNPGSCPRTSLAQAFGS